MKTHCEKCGCKFTNAELDKIMDESEGFNPMFICDECFEMEQNYEQVEHDCFSDADQGL